MTAPLPVQSVQHLSGGDWRARGWGAALPLVLAAVAAVLAIFHEVVLFTAATWNSNETYTHGWVIVPISAWLIWRSRSDLARFAPRPQPLMLAPLAVFGAAWGVGHLAGVMVVQQYAVMAMAVAAGWTVLGTAVMRRIAFPLAYLFFAVPFGEVFLGPMMNFTADFTVAALRLTGIPVYREGLMFTIPSGNWSVVEACSGLRYLIAALTLGLLYAHLTYRSLWKRVAFTAASIVIPVLANGARAYLIVMIGHLSDMRLAVGVDHLVYGWVFFGVVMLLLFWVGGFWREDTLPPRAYTAPAPALPAASTVGLAAAAFGAVAFSAAWPALVAWFEAAAPSAPVALKAPVAAAPWVAEGKPPLAWRPDYKDPTATLEAGFASEGRRVGLYVGYYSDQRRGAELISSVNKIVESANDEWKGIGQGRREIAIGNDRLTVEETIVKGGGRHLLAWHWFRLSRQNAVSPYLVKLLQARAALRREGDDAAIVVVFAAFDEKPELARGTLEAFVRSMLPAINRSIDEARG